MSDTTVATNSASPSLKRPHPDDETMTDVKVEIQHGTEQDTPMKSIEPATHASPGRGLPSTAVTASPSKTPSATAPLAAQTLSTPEAKPTKRRKLTEQEKADKEAEKASKEAQKAAEKASKDAQKAAEKAQKEEEARKRADELAEKKAARELEKQQKEEEKRKKLEAKEAEKLKKERVNSSYCVL
jgi:hypothetical protein